MCIRGTTILSFPNPAMTPLDEVMKYNGLIQDPNMSMTRDAVEGLVPFVIGALEEMHKEVVRLRTLVETHSPKESANA